MRIAGALCLLFVVTLRAACAAESGDVSQWKDCGDLAGRYTDSRGLTIWITRIGTTQMEYTKADVKQGAFVLELENPNGRELSRADAIVMFAGPPSEEFPEPIEWHEKLELPASMYWLSDNGTDLMSDFKLEKCEAPPSKATKPPGTKPVP